MRNNAWQETTRATGRTTRQTSNASSVETLSSDQLSSAQQHPRRVDVSPEGDLRPPCGSPTKLTRGEITAKALDQVGLEPVSEWAGNGRSGRRHCELQPRRRDDRSRTAPARRRPQNRRPPSTRRRRYRRLDDCAPLVGPYEKAVQRAHTNSAPFGVRERHGTRSDEDPLRSCGRSRDAHRSPLERLPPGPRGSFCSKDAV
jgi:hypothetical protein